MQCWMHLFIVKDERRDEWSNRNDESLEIESDFSNIVDANF